MKEGACDAVDNDPPGEASSAAILSAWRAKEQKAFQIIVLACENNQLIHVKKAATGRIAWTALKSHHQQSTIGAQIRVMKKLFRTQLRSDGDMREHLDKMFGFLDILGEMDAALNDRVSVSAILASLNEEYDNVVTAIEAWEQGRITIHAIKGKLIEEWEKRNATDGASGSKMKKL